MLRFAESLSGYAEIESNPKLEGKTMMMMLTPKKEI